MTREEFATVTHFTPEEWAPLDGVKATLVYEVDAWRDWLGRRVVIHEAFATSGHAADSQHARGLAVDLHVEGLSVWDTWLAAERWPSFRGVGVYPFRQSVTSPQGWAHPGLHLDVRDAAVRARWYRDGTGGYHSLTGADLARLLT